LPSIRVIVAAVAALLLAPAAEAADVAVALAERFSVSDVAPRPPSGLTLLEPAWLLPPIESLDMALALAEEATLPGQLVAESAATDPGPARPTGGPLSYPLSDHLSAQLRYRRAQSFDRSGSRSLRDDQSTAVSTLPNRDVFDLKMSWRLAGNNTVGLGYQLQSSAGGVWGAAPQTAAGFSRFLPGNQQATHSFMFGLTREWGADEAPPLAVEPPLLLSDLEPDAVDATPTAAP
jgi:hypothetical protein